MFRFLLSKLHHRNGTRLGAFFVSVVEHQSDSNLVRAPCSVLQILTFFCARKGSHFPTEDLKASFKGEGRGNIDA